MQTRRFETIRGVVEYCKKHFSDDDYIFRGQKKNWPLTSSLFRHTEMERKDLLLETDNFCTWIKDNPVLQPFHDSPDAILAIAQHYSDEFGFATDLIDFTRDIAVAGFFAASGKTDPQEEGVIYVTSISWFESIYNTYTNANKEQYKKSDEQIPAAFYIPELPQVGGFWRLEAQKGLFMRDYHSLVSQKPHTPIEYKLTFKRQEGKTITDYYPEINKQVVWPPRNELEWEIERYKSIRLQSRPLPKSITEYSTPIYVGIDTEFEEFQNKAPLLDWSTGAEKWKTLDQTSLVEFPKIICTIEDEEVLTSEHRSTEQIETENEKIMLEFTNENAELRSFSPQHLHVVRLLRKKVLTRAGSTIAMHIEFESKINSTLEAQAKPLLKLLQQALKELLTMTLDYPYSDSQIAMAIQNLFAIAFHAQNTPAGDSGKIAMSDAFKERDIWELKFGDKSHITMQGYAPMSYFNRIESVTELRKMFNKEHPEYHLNKNLQLVQIFTDIHKLLTLSEAVELWSSIMLPWQLLFQAAHARIINPYYLVVFGLP